jgi:hypothetical protein
MRPPKTLPALVFAVLLAAPAPAQVKTDLGAAATSGVGTSASAGAAGVGVAPIPSLNLSPSALSLGAAPTPNLAPAARSAEAALPASAFAAPALTPAAAASVGDAASAPKAAAAASALPPAGPPSAAAAAAPPGSPPVPFVAALNRLGVPEAMTSRLLAFLDARHPGNQDLVYHGEGHSFEVAGVAARIAESSDLTADRKILLIFSAALHDVDPERVPGTPARVSATLSHLDSDAEAAALVAAFGSRYGFDAAQVKALIMATDFSMDPAEMKAKQDAAAVAARAAFPGEDFGLEWGRRLAFADQSATYVGDLALARRRVEGLAYEIRANLKAMGKEGGPTDAQILAGTSKFLGVLRNNPDFAILPSDLQDRFAAVQSYFDARQTPEAWAAEASPVPARAPPDLAAAQAYVRGIAGKIALTEKQTDALLLEYFEQEGIDPGSERAVAVRTALLPARARADDDALRGLDPVLRRRRTILLKLAADHRTTPAAIEAVLKRDGVLDAIADLSDALFERQANRALSRAERERFVAPYPDTVQGRFLRAVADAMSAASGKSVEEIARDGVFAYVDFNGSKVRRATVGRDPDVRAVQAVMYVTLEKGRWRVGGYRQNVDLHRKDSELSQIVKNWLISGGIPRKDLE